MTAHRSVLAAATAALTVASAVIIGTNGASASDVFGKPHDSQNNRIVAGTFMQAPDGAVSLYAPSYNGFSCSASRIGANWVLTARHCAELNPSRVYTNSLTRVKGDYANIVQKINAPNGDVALLKLDSNPPGKILPWSATPLNRGDQVLMRGWGMEGTNDSGPQNLKGATGTFAGTGTNPFYQGQDILVNGGNGAPWKGDSGGPVTKDGVLYGALSWSSSYGRDRSAQAGYGSIVAHAQWIQQTTGIAPNSGGGNGGGTTTQPTNPTQPRPTNTESDPQPTTNIPSHVEVNSGNWQQVLQSSYVRPLVLDFGATWCGACQQLKPRIERLNQQGGGKWTLGAVDVDRNPSLPRQYGANAYPTVVMLWQGKEIPGTRFVGANPDSDIQQRINKALQYAQQNPGQRPPTNTNTTPPTNTNTTPPVPTSTTPPVPTSTTPQPTGSGSWTWGTDNPRDTDTPVPTSTGNPTDSTLIPTITDKNYQWLLDQSKGRTVFLDFSKDGCEPCAALHPVLVEKAKALGNKTIIGQMDGTQFPAIWNSYQSPWFPTVIAIRDGKELARHTGYAGDAAEMNAWIDKAMLGSASSDPLVFKADEDNWNKVVEMSWRHPVLIAYTRSDGKCPTCDANIATLKAQVAQDGGKWTLVTIDLNDANTYSLWTRYKVKYADSIDTFYRDEMVQDRLLGKQTAEGIKAHIAKTLSTHYPPKDNPTPTA